MAKATITFKVHVAWWLRWYLFGMVAMCWLIKMQPNQERMSYWIGKAITVRISNA